MGLWPGGMLLTMTKNMWNVLATPPYHRCLHWHEHTSYDTLVMFIYIARRCVILVFYELNWLLKICRRFMPDVAFTLVMFGLGIWEAQNALNLAWSAMQLI